MQERQRQQDRQDQQDQQELQAGLQEKQEELQQEQHARLQREQPAQAPTPLHQELVTRQEQLRKRLKELQQTRDRLQQANKGTHKGNPRQEANGVGSGVTLGASDGIRGDQIRDPEFDRGEMERMMELGKDDETFDETFEDDETFDHGISEVLRDIAACHEELTKELGLEHGNADNVTDTSLSIDAVEAAIRHPNGVYFIPTAYLSYDWGKKSTGTTPLAPASDDPPSEQALRALEDQPIPTDRLDEVLNRQAATQGVEQHAADGQLLQSQTSDLSTTELRLQERKKELLLLQRQMQQQNRAQVPITCTAFVGNDV
jgi:hypothetical protein